MPTVAESFHKQWTSAPGPLPTPCHIWKRSKTRGGYGQLWTAPKRLGGRRMDAHRFAWTLAFGAIPDGLVVMHQCDTPACVNVQHLSLGTPKDNTHDAIAKGRPIGAGKKHAGSRHPNSRINETDVERVRDLARAGCRQRQVAAWIGTSPGTVSKIITGRSWVHVGATS